MKKLITILVLLISFIAQAQKPPSNQFIGSTQSNVEVRGGIFSDSAFWPAIRDTNWTPSTEGVIVYWPAQQQYYGFRQSSWKPFSVGNFEPVIAPSNTINQYWTGFKTFATLNTDSIAVGTTNKFFTNALARAAISITTIGTSGAATYNSSTGVFNIPNYTSGGGGGIDSVGLTMPAIFNVANSPLVGSGGTIGVTFFTQSPNTFFAGPASGGAATPAFRAIQIGDLPSGIPNSNLANSNFNLSIGSAGTSPNWAFTTVNLGSTEILNLPIASAVNTGILLNTDWTTFNNKVTSVNGLFGVVVTKNADSIMHLPVDTTTDRNNYVLTFDSTNHKWFLSPGGGSSGGVITVGTIDGNGASANGGSISGSSIFFQSASVSNPGLVNNTTQSFSGNKTFIGSLTLTGITNKVVGGTDSALIRDASGKVWVTVIGPGGIGAPNSNIGAGYRAAVPFTNNVKTFFAGYAQKIDSTSNTNGLTFFPDTLLVVPYTDTSKVNGIASKTFLANNYVSLTGSYANPTWITSLAWSKITGAPAFITLSSLSATSPVLYNNSTGVISFATSGVGAGSCTSCNLTYDAFGRITVAGNGSGGSGNNIQFKSLGTNLNALGATTTFNTANSISGTASGGNTVTYQLTNDSAITSGEWFYGFHNGRYGWASSNDTIFYVNGLAALGTNPAKDSAGLGGALYQATRISGKNLYPFYLDSMTFKIDGANVNTPHSLDTTNFKIIVRRPSDSALYEMSWPVFSGGGSGMAIAGVIGNGPKVHAVLFVGTGGTLQQDSTFFSYDSTFRIITMNKLHFGQNTAYQISTTDGHAVEFGDVMNPSLDQNYNLGSPTLKWNSTQTWGLSTGYVAKTSNYNLAASDNVVDFTSGSSNATLPTAVGITGTQFTIKNTGAGTTTVLTTSSQTIDGASSYSLSSQYAWVTVQSNGANWLIISSTSSAGSGDVVTTITSGTSSTVPNGTNVIRFNNTSPLTYTLTLPTTWASNSDLWIDFTANGTITNGNAMVTLTIVGGSGQTLSNQVPVSSITFNAGESIHYHLIGTVDQRRN